MPRGPWKRSRTPGAPMGPRCCSIRHYILWQKGGRSNRAPRDAHLKAIVCPEQSGLDLCTDIIVKDRRETLFGHKICLTGGARTILDCWILEGNPADSERCRCWTGKKTTGAILSKPASMVASPPRTISGEITRIKDVCFAKNQGNRHVPQSICLPPAAPV